MCGEDVQVGFVWKGVNLCTGEPAVVFVEEPSGGGLGVLENPEDLLNLMDRLNQNGLRERALFQTLQKRYDSILNSLGHRLVNLDIQTAPR